MDQRRSTPLGSPACAIAPSSAPWRTRVPASAPSPTSASRISATFGDFRSFWFREKRGREREIPVRYDLDEWLAAYLAAANIADDPKDAPFFRPLTRGRTAVESRPLQPWTIRTILKRRLKAAGLPTIITPHSFRTMVVTDLLSQGVSTEHVQYLVGHARPSTTQLYDRRAKRVTRNIVERISV